MPVAPPMASVDVLERATAMLARVEEGSVSLRRRHATRISVAPVGEVPMATTTGNAAVSIVVRKVIAQRNETRVKACVHDVVRVHLTADTDALHRVSAESERHDGRRTGG